MDLTLYTQSASYGDGIESVCSESVHHCTIGPLPGSRSSAVGLAPWKRHSVTSRTGGRPSAAARASAEMIRALSSWMLGRRPPLQPTVRYKLPAMTFSLHLPADGPHPSGFAAPNVSRSALSVTSASSGEEVSEEVGEEAIEEVGDDFDEVSVAAAADDFAAAAAAGVLRGGGARTGEGDGGGGGGTSDLSRN